MLSITSLGIAPGGVLDPSDAATPTTPPTRSPTRTTFSPGALVPTTNYVPPPNYACTPGLCVQQLQALLNLAVAANLPAGQSFPSISVDGNIGQTTINSILFMANTGIPQFALFDVSVTPDWIAANVAGLVQSYATYLGVDPASLVALDASQPPQQVYQPPADQPPSPDQQPAAFILCPDGSSAADISLCPPPTAGPQMTTTPPPMPTLMPQVQTAPAQLISMRALMIGSVLALISGIALSFSSKRRGLGIGLGLAGLGGGYLALRQSGGFYAG
jgi:hypothetical protein